MLLMSTNEIKLTWDDIQTLILVYSIFKGIEGGMARVHSTHVKTAHYM